MNRSSVIEITDKLDAHLVQSRLGVGHRSIRLARERGVFPASWYPVIADLCDEAGLDCPRDAFTFKGVSA